MSSKYLLNQFGKLSKSEYKYATKKFNKYTKNIKLNPRITNSLITPISSKIKIPIIPQDKVLRSLSRKKQIKSILKKNLLNNKNLLQSNRNRILKNMSQKKRIGGINLLPFASFL